MTMNYTADQLVFLDESSKDGHVVNYGRAPSEQEAIHHVSLNRGVRYSILPAPSLNDYMAVRVVEGSIDGAEFYGFVANDVVSPLSWSKPSSSFSDEESDFRPQYHR